MSALENVMVGAHTRLNASFAAALIRLPRIVRRDFEPRDEAADLMAFVGLDGYRRADAAAMPYGGLKRLEIARALQRTADSDAGRTGGRPQPNRNNAKSKADQAGGGDGATVLLVEHNMQLVMGVSHRILVLDYGRRFAGGLARGIRCVARVIAAYLGADA